MATAETLNRFLARIRAIQPLNKSEWSRLAAIGLYLVGK